jgi:hypothetical protein
MAGFSQFQQDNKRFAGWPVRCTYPGQEAVMKKVLTIAMVSGLSFSVVMPAQEDPGVREAIRFERSKDAAAAREARIEGQGSAQSAPAEAKEANPESDVQKAVAFERAKDDADARQARTESRGTSVANARANATSPRYSHR